MSDQNSLQAIQSISEISDDYDVVISDLWGVVHNGKAPYPGAPEALMALRDQKKAVILLSNSPRSRERVIMQLDEIGVPRAAYDEVISSGQLTLEALKNHPYGSKALYIGPDRDKGLLDILALNEGDIDTAGFILCTGPYNDAEEGPEDYAEVLAVAKSRSMPFVCANPDIQVMKGDQIIYCAGALAEAYAKIGGDCVIIGKPKAMAFDAALKAANLVLGRIVGPDRALMIGDGLFTDIKGAMDRGLDALVIAQGIHKDILGFRPGRPLDAGRAADGLARHGLTARAIAEMLVI